MADFAKWGCGVAEVLGLTHEDFLRAYQENIDRQNEEALSASLVGVALLDMAENEYLTDEELGELTGSPTDFLGWLNTAADRLGIDKNQRMWPKNPHWAIRRTLEIKTNLSRVGIEIHWHYRDNNSITFMVKKRQWKKSADVPDVADVESGAGSNTT